MYLKTKLMQATITILVLLTGLILGKGLSDRAAREWAGKYLQFRNLTHVFFALAVAILWLTREFEPSYLKIATPVSLLIVAGGFGYLYRQAVQEGWIKEAGEQKVKMYLFGKVLNLAGIVFFLLAG